MEKSAASPSIILETIHGKGARPMKKEMLTLCYAALSFALVATPPAWAGSKMDGKAVKKLISGKTVTGVAGKDIKFRKTYKTDGTYTLLREGTPPLEGKWWITGDEYCQTRGKYTECYTVTKEGGRFTMTDRTKKLRTKFTVHP
ncbi:MAG: hypothetical protein WC790_01780 [Candidatus Paceibacterota bacterium]